MTDRNHPHSCPYCELRFLYHTEVVDHVRRDHPDHADSVAGIATQAASSVLTMNLRDLMSDTS